jgi:hypothetical protein
MIAAMMAIATAGFPSLAMSVARRGSLTIASAR